MKIYNSWYGHFNSRLYTEIMFKPEVTDNDVYNAILKTMRYIGNNLCFANTESKAILKNDLHEVRQYAINLFQNEN